jgi:hypothetical protein
LGLYEGKFIERAALVNPATIFGPHLISDSAAGVGLKPDTSGGLQHSALGLINSFVERSTC